jgi:hypothetical protein
MRVTKMNLQRLLKDAEIINGIYNKELLKKIIDDMSDDAFAKFCEGTCLSTVLVSG